MVDKRVVDVMDRYSNEILEINNRLNQLESLKIYDLIGYKMDGSLSTHASKIRRMIVELIIKIEYNTESIGEKMQEVANKMNMLFED